MGLKGLAALVVAGTAAAVAAGCAQTPAPGQTAQGGGQCFLPSQVTGFRAVDDDTVNAFVGAGDVYQLELGGGCTNVDWSLQIGIRSTGGGSWVCGDLDSELVVPSPMGTQRCPITGMRKLDPEAARAARGG